MMRNNFFIFLICLVMAAFLSGCYGSSYVNEKYKKSLTPELPITAPTPAPKFVKKVVAGYHNCVIYDRNIDCWGKNDFGQIGVIGALSQVDSPLTVFSQQTITQADVGDRYTCIIIDGGLSCVGEGTFGSLGNGSMASSTSFVHPFPAGSNVTEVSIGSKTTCAVVDGGLYCWGAGTSYQNGDGLNSNRSTPYQVFAPASDVTKVAVGPAHVCAVVASELWCWGNNSSGQIGKGNLLVQTVPLKITLLGTGVTDVAAGDSHTGAIKNGGLWCWGYNLDGQVGDNYMVDRSSPVSIFPALSGVIQVSIGMSHSCDLVNSELKCWGANRSGQLNDTVSINPKLTPFTVLNSTSMITDFASGPGHVCVVEQNSKVYCWGTGDFGNNSQGDSITWTTPQNVLGLESNVNKLANSFVMYDDSNFANCAIHNGGVKCWGDNSRGQLGNNSTTASLIVPVIAISNGCGATQVQVRHESTCAIVSGGVRCWRRNNSGQIGDGTTVDKLVPTQIFAAGSNVTQVAFFGSPSIGTNATTCAVVAGGLKCLGNNAIGLVGDGTTTNRSSPVDIFPPGSGVTDIFGSETVACVIKNSGLYCWGSNDYGSLGLGDYTARLTPALVIPEGSGVTVAEVSEHQGCAVVAGGLKCWGDTTFGLVLTLCNYSTKPSLVPIAVLGPGSNVQDVKMMYSYGKTTCALINGGYKCWGFDDGFGVMGNGQFTKGAIFVNGFE